MLVAVFNEQQDLAIDPQQVITLVKHVFEVEDRKADEVSIHFVDKQTISQLHLDYFDDPTPTDCITFPQDTSEMENYCLLGDVFVCPKVADEYSQENTCDKMEETSLYVVHGLLHLFGYDDIEEDDERKMRAAETKHIESLKKAGKLLG